MLIRIVPIAWKILLPDERFPATEAYMITIKGHRLRYIVKI